MVFSELVGYEVWFLTLIWVRSQSSLFYIFIQVIFFFSFWFSPYMCVISFVAVHSSQILYSVFSFVLSIFSLFFLVSTEISSNSKIFFFFFFAILSRKTSTSGSSAMLKPLTLWITTGCGKFFKRWEYQITLPVSWKICMQVKKQQLEPEMEQWTGSKLGKE